MEYLHGDLLGSVRAITDSTGAVVGASTFDAFGSRTAHTGTGDSAFGFTGSWTDPDTHLVHLRARDYDPATGQFLSVDPAVDSTRQPYAYTGNSPLDRTDPSGLDFWSDARDLVLGAAQFVRDSAGCALEQVAAFGAGALDSLTFGLSSAVLGAMVPGYDEFVAGHEAAFTAGSVTVTVIQAAVMIVGTLGAGTGLAIGLVVVKTVVKAAVKSVVKGVERTAVRTAERLGLRGGARTADSIPANLTYKPGWSAAQRIAADSKVAVLNRANPVVSSSTRSGTSAASRYRAAGNDVPTGSDVDHILDLQLGGADDLANLAPLDMSVNRSLGSQISNAIRGAEPGTPVGPFTIMER